MEYTTETVITVTADLSTSLAQGDTVWVVLDNAATELGKINKALSVSVLELDEGTTSFTTLAVSGNALSLSGYADGRVLELYDSLPTQLGAVSVKPGIMDAVMTVTVENPASGGTPVFAQYRPDSSATWRDLVSQTATGSSPSPSFDITNLMEDTLYRYEVSLASSFADAKIGTFTTLREETPVGPGPGTGPKPPPAGFIVDAGVKREFIQSANVHVSSVQTVITLVVQASLTLTAVETFAGRRGYLYYGVLSGGGPVDAGQFTYTYTVPAITSAYVSRTIPVSGDPTLDCYLFLGLEAEDRLSYTRTGIGQTYEFKDVETRGGTFNTNRTFSSISVGSSKFPALTTPILVEDPFKASNYAVGTLRSTPTTDMVRPIARIALTSPKYTVTNGVFECRLFDENNNRIVLSGTKANALRYAFTGGTTLKPPALKYGVVDHDTDHPLMPGGRLALRGLRSNGRPTSGIPSSDPKVSYVQYPYLHFTVTDKALANVAKAELNWS